MLASGMLIVIVIIKSNRVNSYFPICFSTREMVAYTSRRMMQFSDKAHRNRNGADKTDTSGNGAQHLRG